jgi:hypothetical protein
LCTAQNHSSSPDSSVVCPSISSGATYSIFLWKGETLFRVSLGHSCQRLSFPQGKMPFSSRFAAASPAEKCLPRFGRTLQRRVEELLDFVPKFLFQGRVLSSGPDPTNSISLPTQPAAMPSAANH